MSRDCGEIRCTASITRGPSVSSSTQLRLKSSSKKIRENHYKNLEPRSRSLPRIKNDENFKKNGSTSSLKIDDDKLKNCRRAASFTRLMTKSRESSSMEKPPIADKNNDDGSIDGRLVKKLIKKKKNCIQQTMQPIEITIEPIKTVRLNIEPVETVRITIDPEFNDTEENEEIDKSIVDILAKENIIRPITFFKSTSPTREQQQQTLSINRISSSKNSRCSPGVDTFDRSCYEVNNDNHDQIVIEEECKKKTISSDRSARSSLSKIHGGKKFNGDQRTTRYKKPKSCDASSNEVPALVLKPPEDAIALRGSTVELNTIYQGQPEPSVKWMRAVS